MTDTPQKNERCKEMWAKEGSLLWFVEFSYKQYIAPRGFVQHMKFAWDLPTAAFKYWRAMREKP